jgi:hypothetical protein
MSEHETFNNKMLKAWNGFFDVRETMALFNEISSS